MTPRDLRLTHCVLCGSMVNLGRGPVYALDEDCLLCFPCAVLKGGIYDEAAHSWVALPARAGLPPSAEQRDARKDRPFFGTPSAGQAPG